MSIKRGLHTNENVLVAVDVLLHGRSAFLGVFLMAFMISVSAGQSPVSYIVYNLVRYICMGLFTLLFLWFIKRHTLAAWRISAMFSVSQILAVIVLDPTAPYFPYVIAVLSAFESTLYWRSKMYYDIVEVSNERRLQFKAIGQMLSEVVKIIMPVILGLSIVKTSYTFTAFIILAISVFQLLLSILFRPTHHPVGKKVDFHTAYERIVDNHGLQKVMILQFLRGLIMNGSAYMLIVAIHLYSSVSSSLDLGIYTAIGSVVSVIVISIYRRIAKIRGAQMTGLVGLAVPIILLPLICYFFPDDPVASIAFYVYIHSIFDSLYNGVASVKRIQDLIKKHLRDDSVRIEVESMSEIALTMGRVITLSILLFMVVMGWQRYILLFATLSSLAIVPLVRLLLSRRETAAISTSN